jgi:23S rRNA (uridine2552-2'-O)-methyltransferase
LDILVLEPIPGVEFLQGDFTTEEINQKLIGLLNSAKADIVISDMAPNISGIVISDQARSIYLAELALEFAQNYLKPGGNFLVKLFHGGGFDEFVKKSRQDFEKIVVKKPEASRDRSKEVYLLGLKKKQRD